MKEQMYFAYGSNINIGQMACRCPAATPVCPVVLDNYRLAFRGGGGVATIIPAEGEKVYGLLWKLTPVCEQALDQYEGYPRLYVKEQVTVAWKGRPAISCHGVYHGAGILPRSRRTIPAPISQVLSRDTGKMACP